MAEVALTLPEAMEQAIAAYGRGQLGEADRLARTIISIKPDHFDALHLVAFIDMQQGRLDEALAGYDRALAVRPDDPHALYNRGVTLHLLRRFEAALASYDRALAVQPDYAEALSNRGVTLYELQQFEAALASYDRALALRPDFAEVLSNRGNALQALKRLDAALASYDRALAVRPDYAEALSNRGVTLHRLQRFEEALASYDRALAVRPDYAEALSNRGNTLQELKQFDAALACYDRALALQPDYAEAHFNKSLLQLLKGDFDAGWREYEWRWKNANLKLSKRNFAEPLWLGEAAIAGKTILLHGEQGLGDTIQFCRYAPLVAARGARVLLEVPAPLKDLMASLAGVAQLISAEDQYPHFDLHCPLHSLPLALGTRIATIPAQVPYLTAPPQSMRRWSAALGSKHRLRVGVAWSGAPTHRNDVNRSIKLRSLLPLFDVDADFVSLQRDVRADDAAVLQDCGDLTHFTDELENLRRYRRSDREPGSGDFGRYQRRPSGRSIGQAGLGLVGLCAGLSLAARSRGQPLVSDCAAVSPRCRRRLVARDQPRRY
jgi:tetratricopeptide (TPR) repeat protein